MVFLYEQSRSSSRTGNHTPASLGKGVGGGGAHQTARTKNQYGFHFAISLLSAL